MNSSGWILPPDGVLVDHDYFKVRARRSLAPPTIDLIRRACTYSLRKASTGFMRAARHAGNRPDKMPVSAETARAMTTIPGDNVAGMALRRSRVAGQAINNAMAPPIRQMQAASIRNCSMIVRLLAPMALR